MKKAILMVMVGLAATAFPSMAQDASKFNGTWKGDGGQVRKLTFKNGVIYMEETQPSGMVILRQYPTQGQEITMTEGVWKDAKATGKLEGNKLVVETTQGNGTQWHDEWTMADDGKTYSALRVNVTAATRAAGGPGGGGPPAGAAPASAPPAGGGAPRGGGGGRGRGGPETFTRIE